MKKFRIYAALLIAVMMFAIVFSACGSSAKDVPTAELAEKIADAVGLTSLADPGESYVRGYMKKSADEIGDYAIRMNVTGTNIDEFGVFKAGTMTVKELETLVNDYLQLRRDGWMDEYMPEEKPKLMNAEVRTLGDYVMYAILSEADCAAANDAFETALK